MTSTSSLFGLVRAHLGRPVSNASENGGSSLHVRLTYCITYLVAALRAVNCAR